MKTRFPKGTICYRCGITKKEQRKDPGGCSTWGRFYPRHYWNREATTINVVTVKIKQSNKKER